mgnify:CR=1 FL=1
MAAETKRDVTARTGVRPPADAVNHPTHYNSHPSGVEAIEIVEHFNFNVGNAIKYLWRAGLKGNALEDLHKAVWYVQREIRRLEAYPRDLVMVEAPQALRDLVEESVAAMEAEEAALERTYRTAAELLEIEAPARARDLLFYLDEPDGVLSVRLIAEMPRDHGVVAERAGALVYHGVAYARSEGCARTASRNSQFYSGDECLKFSQLAEQIARWRTDLAHEGAYVQVRPFHEG